MTRSSSVQTSRWVHAWPDAVAFVGGLAIAWWARWRTTDLVWSLWLSSLVVGYALIVWTLSASAREFAANAFRNSSTSGGAMNMGAGVLVGGGLLFGLAFFTVHFGGFHFVHSVFLNLFFPLTPEGVHVNGFPNVATYLEVFRRYWIFLPVAFLAERAAFRANPLAVGAAMSNEPGSLDRRSVAARGDMMAPYRNVVRMHLLIFFFAAAHFMGLENFAIYAVVYAVYFFPWARLKRTASPDRV